MSEKRSSVISKLKAAAGSKDCSSSEKNNSSTSASSKLPWGLQNDRLAPGSMKTITEQKIKAFQSGTMNYPKKTLSKRELEDFKRKEEQIAAQEVYKDFVASFSDNQKAAKTFVKGTVIQAGLSNTVEECPPDKGRPYKGTSSKLQELALTFKSYQGDPKGAHASTSSVYPGTVQSDTVQAPLDHQPPVQPQKPRKSIEKRKSNLEAFKDELKRIQEERDRRHELKRKLQEQEESGRKTRFEPYIPSEPPIESELSLDEASLDKGCSDDPETTNLFISNLSRTLNETEIMELFGNFGPLASVKIMYPRSEEERSRGSNCGFVAFMDKDNASNALEKLDGHELGGLALRLSWGKPITIPLCPVYTKPEDCLHGNGKRTGYPFNATPPPGFPELDKVTEKPSPKYLNKLLGATVIKVNIPINKKLLCLIHRTIEFVIQEGPKFEQALLEKEKDNPMFRFLDDNTLDSHIYYRWKLFSILQGDSVYHWSECHFKMFKHGSIWIPPALPVGKHNMVSNYDESFERAKAESREQNRSPGQGKKPCKLSDILEQLSPDRDSIADAMVYAIERAHIAESIAKTICENVEQEAGNEPRKIAHLFLISDILHNCSFGVFNASSYRKAFEELLPSVFKRLHDCCIRMESRVKTEQFRSKVMMCFRAWEDWTVYPSDFLIKLQNIFLGLANKSAIYSYQEGCERDETEGDDLSNATISAARPNSDAMDIDDIDGTPMDDSDVNQLFTITDTGGMSKFTTRESINEHTKSDILVVGNEDSTQGKGFFVTSKWETVESNPITDACKFIGGRGEQAPLSNTSEMKTRETHIAKQLKSRDSDKQDKFEDDQVEPKFWTSEDRQRSFKTILDKDRSKQIDYCSRLERSRSSNSFDSSLSVSSSTSAGFNTPPRHRCSEELILDNANLTKNTGRRNSTSERHDPNLQHLMGSSSDTSLTASSDEGDHRSDSKRILYEDRTIMRSIEHHVESKRTKGRFKNESNKRNERSSGLLGKSIYSESHHRHDSKASSSSSSCSSTSKANINSTSIGDNCHVYHNKRKHERSKRTYESNIPDDRRSGSSNRRATSDQQLPSQDISTGHQRQKHSSLNNNRYSRLDHSNRNYDKVSSSPSSRRSRR